MLQTPPDTIRHGPDTTRYHHTCIMYGLYGLKHHTVEISGDVTDPDGRTNEQPTRKDRATQLLIREPLSFAIVFFDWPLGGGAPRAATHYLYTLGLDKYTRSLNGCTSLKIHIKEHK